MTATIYIHQNVIAGQAMRNVANIVRTERMQITQVSAYKYMYVRGCVLYIGARSLSNYAFMQLVSKPDYI